jgi:hypothetical protein
VTAVDLGIAGLTAREVGQLTTLLGKLRRAAGDFDA